MKCVVFRLLGLAVAAASWSVPVFAQAPVPRQAAPLGAIVANKGGEELRFVKDEAWRPAEVRQDLVGGDTLRTNMIGNLGILFSDQTQIRVGPRSTLVLNDIASGDRPTSVELPAGNVWARAARGGTGVVVKTPAAAATIRGTDWSLSVDGSKTSLVVIEGVVDLTNPQGSVTVRQGEAAVATIGSAPTKIILVKRKEREQMLLHLTLRDAFTWMPATPLQGAALRREKARIEALAPTSRSAEDRLTLAEVSLGRETRDMSAALLREAEAGRLTPAQRARADLVAATLAARERRWSDAARLFKRAEAGLSGRRRVTAAYGGYIAASLADPRRVLPEPKIQSGDGYSALLKAFLTGFTSNLEDAAKVAEAAERLHPNDTLLGSFGAQVSYALDRRDAMRERVEKLSRLDPDDPLVLLTRSMLKGDVDSDLDGALADLQRAAALAPGDAQVWNAIGLIQSARDAQRESEAAFRRAIEVDPDSPVAYANLAITLLDQSRVDEVAVLIDKALAVDPAFYVAYTAKGRLLLQRGDSAKAIEYFLAGTAANPSYANGVLAAAIGYYMDGQVDLAEQQLDAADRLDPSDPVTSVARTAIAIDMRKADDAIENARESIRRFRNRGGYYAPLAHTKAGGSYMSEAYRLIGLDAWARYYGDRVFDPFTSTGYFDQANARSLPSLLETVPDLKNDPAAFDLQAFNLIVQGLLYDPLAVAGRAGRIDLLRRPFLDTEVSGGVVARDGRAGWQSGVTVQGFSNLPYPTSFVVSANAVRAPDPLTREWDVGQNGSFFVGSAPSSADRFLMFGSFSRLDPRFVLANGGGTARLRNEVLNGQVGLGWSHTFSDRNVVNVAVTAASGATRQGSLSAFELAPFPGVPVSFPALASMRDRQRLDVATASVNHTVGVGDVSLRYGVEGQVGRATATSLSQQFILDPPVEGDPAFARTRSSFRSGRVYADALWRPSDRFEAEAGLFGTLLRAPEEAVSVRAGPDQERTVRGLGPRLGLAVSPWEGQWLRAVYRQDVEQASAFTLSPVTTIGIAPNLLPASLGGRMSTAALRWDAEWSKRFFTAVEYQRQTAGDLGILIPNLQTTLAIDKARIDRVTATANLWLGGGVGVFATVGAADSEITRGLATGLPVPFIPERFARAGVTFVHPSRLKLTVAETVVSRRRGDLAGTRIDDFASTDASLTWETPDRRLQMGVAVYNIFDEKAERSSGLLGSGRTVTATATARF
ncbi:FecR domain-containing protein [Alsobacter sp. KACC 23698]|uniref:FecR domain-containing protein n=1 Tax=Alsobacter sp. KACC 23698 TaxID=3149229 RepID=A0AAU7JM43_9HYPH